MSEGRVWVGYFLSVLLWRAKCLDCANFVAPFYGASIKRRGHHSEWWLGSDANFVRKQQSESAERLFVEEMTIAKSQSHFNECILLFVLNKERSQQFLLLAEELSEWCLLRLYYSNLVYN